MARRKYRKHPKFWLGFRIFILLFLLAILVGGIIFYFKYGKDLFRMHDEAKALVEASTTDTFRTSETTIAYDKNGKAISVLKGEKDTYYMDINTIPTYVKDAFIVTEDKKFYEHNGIDYGGIMRAAWAYVKNGGVIKQGASTITQQLARNIYLSTEKTAERKTKEIFIALAMEEKYTKDQILEFYLNSIYFSNGYYGIEAAAKGYFSKSCPNLSLGELTFLCAIPNNPNLYNPLKNFNNTIKRKNRILDQMLADGVINRVEYDEAYNAQIVLKQKEVERRDYIETFINYSATRALMKYNGFEFRSDFDSDKDRNAYDDEYEKEYARAQKMLLNGGYRIHTSIDLKKQKKLQKAVNNQLSTFKGKTSQGIYKMQGSAVCIDNKDGRVVAIVGGRKQKTQGYSLNRAFQSFRQPGSCMKPLIVYTPTLERGSNANTVVHDYRFSGGPSNSNGRYYGHVSLRFAVQQSLNTVAWQLLQKLTPEVGLDYLKQMNFSKIMSGDYNLSASLGGLTYGCSALEMASAYATLANSGKYREPTCVVKIEDAKGNEIVGDAVDSKFIYSSDAANSMTDIMKGVFTNGTARGLGLENGMTCAGKTGTTNDKKDGWFCGYTPYYTTAVWVGFDTPKSVDDLFGSTYPGRTWQQFMNAIHKKLKVKGFKYEKNQSSSGNNYSSSSNRNNDNYSGGGGSVDKDPDDKKDVDKDPDDSMEEEEVQQTKAPAVQQATKEPPTQTQAPEQQKPEEPKHEATAMPDVDKDPDDDLPVD